MDYDYLDGCNRNSFAFLLSRKTASNIKISEAFVSLHVQQDRKPCAKDDLISLCYLLIYLQTGSLPWLPREGRPFSIQSMLTSKMITPIRELCKGIPGFIKKKNSSAFLTT